MDDNCKFDDSAMILGVLLIVEGRGLQKIEDSSLAGADLRGGHSWQVPPTPMNQHFLNFIGFSEN